MQADDRGKHSPIAFASRVLTIAESHYSVTDFETLAIVWSLRHFRDLIYSFQVTVYTDHQAVKGLFKGKNLTGRLARWLVILEDYQPSIEYVSGKFQVVADALSSSIAAPLITSQPQSQFTVACLFHAQRDDPKWSQVINFLETGDASHLPHLPYYIFQFSLNDDLLVRQQPSPPYPDVVATQLVIPTSMVSPVLSPGS